MAENLSEIDIEKMFEEYIPGEDPSAALLGHCLYDSMTDATKENTLNSILCKLANSVMTFGRVSPAVVIRDISNWKLSGGDGKVSRKATRSECAVYLENDRTRTIVDIPPEEFIETSKMSLDDKNRRKDWVGRRAWGDIVALVEVKYNHNLSAFEFKKPDERFTRHHSEHGTEALDHFLEHIARIMAHQHRTHVFALYVYRDQARLCYFDRSGGVVSKPFHYGPDNGTTFQRFFYRLAGMTREQLGFDPTATLASEEVVNELRTWAATLPTYYLRDQAYQALCWDPETGRLSSVEWPVHRIAFKDKTLYVGKPTFAHLPLFGRCTRGYVAIEKEIGDDGGTTYALRYLKDSWRLIHCNARAEHEVYERLVARGVSDYIPTCLGGEDVADERGVWQQTTTWAAMRHKGLPGGHYRILLKEVCRPLSHFCDFADLAMVLGDALAAHQDAWIKAEVLHHDISYNNILIYNTKNEKGEVSRIGLLADWDLSKYKENMVADFGPTRPDHTGTWYFRSAVSQRYPTKPYSVSDDIESFVHVFHYCVLRFHETEHSCDLNSFVRLTYKLKKRREEDAAHVGGSAKFAQTLCRLSAPMIPSYNQTLCSLLHNLATLCAKHYATIDMAEYDRLYNPPAAVKKATSVEPDADDSERPTTLISSHDSDDDAFDVFVQPCRTFEDHTKLYRLFWRWGATRKWAKCDLTRSHEDLFKNAGLAASKDNAFGSSQSAESGSSQSSGDGNDGTPLASVQESIEGSEDSEDSEGSVGSDGEC